MTSSSKNSERAEKIVHAAAKLFARQGYHGTTTREIARIVEMSENTLFRYFECKEDLFWAALRSRLSGLELRRDLLDGIVGSADPRVVLPLIFAQLVDSAILKPELLRLIAVAFIELHGKAEAVCHEYLSPAFSAVNSYLAMSIETGKLRALDSSLVTGLLAATVMVHPELSRLISGAPPPYSDTREAIRAYSKFWLDALVPPAPDRPRAMIPVADGNSP